MKSCPQCRFENADHARFCGGCGAALKTTAPGLAPPPGERTLVDQEHPRPPTTAGFGATLVDAEAGGAVVAPLGLAGNKQQYEVIEEIGRGGMSVVYRARDRKLHREVALKRLLPQFTQSERAVARLMTEARSIANLGHPNIVAVYDVDQDEDGPYIAMEFVAGQDCQPLTLAEKVQQDGPMGEKEAIDLTLKLCQAVGLAHQKKVIHRDIKPANILLTLAGEPKLVDFGIAHAGEETVGQTFSGMTLEGTTLGTLDFMAPEQEKNAKAADERSDLYALGGVLYFCLTGMTARHFRERAVPEGLRGALSQAMDWAPGQRWQSAAEFAKALRQADEQLRRKLDIMRSQLLCVLKQRRRLEVERQRQEEAQRRSGEEAGRQRQEAEHRKKEQGLRRQEEAERSHKEEARRQAESRRREEAVCQEPPVAQPKRRFPRAAVLVLGLAMVAALGLWTWIQQRTEGPNPSGLPAKTNGLNSPLVVAGLQSGFQKLSGRWRRPDGGFILEIKGVDDNTGKMEAAYLNPRPISVSKAEASREGSTLKVFIELQDVNYPGSTYTLTHDPATDRLTGIYYQAAIRQQFEVAFERTK